MDPFEAASWECPPWEAQNSPGAHRAGAGRGVSPVFVLSIH